MEAFRYIERKYLNDALQGVFYINRLSYFARLEATDTRSDDLEGATRIVANKQFPGVVPAMDRLQLMKLGIGVDENTIGLELHDCEFDARDRDRFILCMTAELNPSLLSEGRDTVIRIKDVEALAEKLRFANRKYLGDHSFGAITYEERISQYGEPQLAPSPFIKRVHYRHEKEIRICWEPLTDRASLLTKSLTRSNLIELVE